MEPLSDSPTLQNLSLGVSLIATCRVECCSPVLPLPLSSTSTQTRTPRSRKPPPCRPSAPRTRRPRWPAPARWRCCSSSSSRPTPQSHKSTKQRNFQLTLHAPPPRFSFHHRVFKMWSLPSSCSFNIAPLIAVLKGESANKANRYTYAAKTKWKNKRATKMAQSRGSWSIFRSIEY